jgi:peptidoglycan hydrolase-like protein with peptidoglycan-binding domain
MKKQITQPEAAPKKNSKRKWLFIGLGVTATGALSYFGWQYFKKNKAKSNEIPDEVPDVNDDQSSSYTPPKYKPTQTRNDNFPLKKGSKGENVKALQQVLIAKLGKDALGKSGADGDFGSKTEAALIKAGLSTSIDETTFNVLVKVSSPDPSQTAAQLYAAAIKKDFAKAVSLLKTLRNTEDYKNVSEAFKNYRIGGVRQTLVNGMLNSFSDEKQKQAIRLTFSSMGLKYDGSKWSLAGFGRVKMLLTNRATTVWKNPKTSVAVPANMVLGREVARRGEYTMFENDSQSFLVKSKHVNYYK